MGFGPSSATFSSLSSSSQAPMLGQQSFSSPTAQKIGGQGAGHGATAQTKGFTSSGAHDQQPEMSTAPARPLKPKRKTKKNKKARRSPENNFLINFQHKPYLQILQVREA